MTPKSKSVAKKAQTKKRRPATTKAASGRKQHATAKRVAKPKNRLAAKKAARTRVEKAAVEKPAVTQTIGKVEITQVEVARQAPKEEQATPETGEVALKQE